METLTPSLCKNGHDKNAVGVLKSGYCRECGRQSRRDYWANATPEQRAHNRQQQRERYEAGLAQKNVTKFICKNGHDKRIVGVCKNGACRECFNQRGRKRALEFTPEHRERRAQQNRELHDRRLAETGITYIRETHLRTMYGLDVETYQKMIADQHGKCAICGQPETRTRNGRVHELSVDHDHVTNKVRKLLCTQCNTGIGKFRDDPQLLIAAAEYLFSFQQVDQPASS